MRIPKLDPVKRDREYNLYSFDEKSKIVHAWLFKSNLGHREMDRDILCLDPSISRGYQSMGVCHYLGLKKEFKGLFVKININQAIDKLRADEQNFGYIIEFLESRTQNFNEFFVKSLYDKNKKQDKDFEKHYKRLEELDNTDRKGNKSNSRKEQQILRALLFKNCEEMQCAICQRNIPINLMVAAHIKPRYKCSTSERKNPKIVMPVCKVGCDEFFEKGYIIIDQMGKVKLNDTINYSSDLQLILADVTDKVCTYFNQDTAHFFKYKRDSYLPQ